MDKRKIWSIINPFTSIYSIAIILFIIATFFVNLWLAIGETAVFLVVLIITNVIKVKKAGEVVNYIEKFSLKPDAMETSDSLFMDFPLPIAVLRVEGKISWYNQEFKDMLEQTAELAEKSIHTFIPELDFSSLLEMEGGSVVIRVGSKFYKVYSRAIRFDKKMMDSYLLVLFFVDVTEYEIVKNRYDSEKTLEAIILIDNYEELYQNTEDGFSAQVFAEIERAVFSWAHDMNGTIRRYERDRYLMIFQQQYLNYIIQNKFEILETVKKISCGNTIEPTLSIGIGKGGESILENDRFASLSIDMALARGGDQAIIKDNKQFSFYGGRTRETERRTKVKVRVTAHALEELMLSASKIYIMGHANADMDAFGAAVALYKIAQKNQKFAKIVLDKVNLGIETIYNKFIRTDNYADAFITTREALDTLNETTLVIVVDTHKASMVEKPELVEKAKKLVVIDHHRRGADFINHAVLAYHEPYASSTCELVAELVQYMSDEAWLTSLEAEALYAGIVMDTKNFTLKTGSRTFEAASYLRRLGVNPLQVKNDYRNDFNLYMERASIVGKATVYRGNIAISVYDEPIKEMSYITASAADELMNIRGIDASFVLSKVKSIVYISGRSYGKINVQVLLEYLGGGGHQTIAGAQIKDVTLDQAYQMLRDAIDQYYNLNETL